MQRDKDLVRKILLYVELNKEAYYDNFSSDQIMIEGYGKEQIAYHCMLILQTGFLMAEDSTKNGSLRISIKGISWLGHEFLDLVRDEKIWNKIKETASEQGVALNTELIISISKDITNNAIA